jgi:hypothetical protein
MRARSASTNRPRVRFPDLTAADQFTLLHGYEHGRIEGFRAAVRLVAERHRDVPRSLVTLVSVACLMAHLKDRKAAARRKPH